jgi:hypothetical protein
MSEDTNMKQFADMIVEDFKKRGIIENGEIKIQGIVNKVTIGKTSLPDGKILNEENIKFELGLIYEDIIEILEYYTDIKKEFHPLVAVWIIGTYCYYEFPTYPYLFVNAMRGSGKTRFLKLISSLASNGELLTSIREAVLFRTAKGKTLCIDEFEGLNKKENAPLRELLNACYKRGMKVKRMHKVKNINGETQEVEEFEPYTPICMANINGMEEVLGDRCLYVNLEKSEKVEITKLIEDFETNLKILDIKRRFLSIQCSLCSVVTKKNIYIWNNYIKDKYTLTTLTTFDTLTTLTTPIYENDLQFFNKIDETGINGRNLELFFPLFVLSNYISKDIFKSILKLANEVVFQRKDDEITESKDVSLYDFVSQLGIQRGFINIKKITFDFRNFIGDDEDEDKWLNPKWVGRALKRLNLIIEKRRVGDGVQVILDIDKALEKIKMFKHSPKEIKEVVAV